MTAATRRARKAKGEAPTDLHAAVADRLEAAEQRYSRGRRALVAVLAGTERPVTSPEIAALDRELSLSSIYRNLGVLEEAGVVRRLVTQEDTARFELSEELTAHHHHLVCERCGEVSDYAPVPQLERAIAAALDAIPRGVGFRPRRHNLEIAGLCARCATAPHRRG